MKKIDLKKTIYELTEEYPELIDLLKNMGFLGVTNPIIRNTVGRKTTLAQGCKLQGKDLSQVIAALEAQGFITDLQE
jgi:hypothetical protein